jgi:hypothetical protein
MNVMTTEATMTSVRDRVLVRRRGGWFVLGSVFAVLALVAGTASAAAWLARRTQVQDQAYPGPITRLVIDASSGDLTLLPGDPGVRVHRHLTWSWTKPVIQESWDAGTLHIVTHCPVVNFGDCAVDYTLRLPAGTPVEAHTSTGDVTVRDWSGPLALTTSTGDVTGTGLSSPSAQTKASTGDVSLAFVHAPSQVQARTSTGDVTIRVPPGGAYQVRTDVSTGDVRVGVAQVTTGGGSIEARTSTGDIDIISG